MIRLWLDDLRPMPTGYTHHAKTAVEAIALLETGQVVAVSLDHDLGFQDVPSYDPETNEPLVVVPTERPASETGDGYDVAMWIYRRAIAGKLGPIELRCHSWNPWGRNRIELAFRQTIDVWRDVGLLK